MAVKPAGSWRNRIVGHGDENPATLAANPKNWRVHPKSQADALSEELDEIGWVQQVMVNRRTGLIVDGHLRVARAIKHAEPSVPVIYVDLSAAEEARVLATLDPLGAMAVTDSAKLSALLGEVGLGTDLLKALGQSVGLGRGNHLHEDPGPQIDRAEELRVKWGTERGQLWLIPSITAPPLMHRLLCGSSTEPADVERAMVGGKAEMVWTDPPYGVAIGDKNKYLNSVGRASSNRVVANLENDTLDEDGLLAMLDDAFNLAAAACLDGGAWYVAAPAGPLHIVFGTVLHRLGIWRQTIQWVKNNATLAPLGVDYHWRAEPIFYGWLPGAGHRYYGGRQQDTVWLIDRPQKSPEHPTMKPVELVARAITNSSLPGQLCYDPFVGSGTTMVAAEQNGRVCSGIEISPGYVAVVLERLHGLGLTPQLEVPALAPTLAVGAS